MAQVSMNNDMRDAVAYPILTEAVDFTNGAPSVSTVPGSGGGSNASPLGSIVNQALRDVLGYKVKKGDVKGFLGALNQSFQLIDDEGHTDFKWIQRSYASGIDADMGAVTGAQASILARAQVAVNQCLPLIDGLYPLDTEVLQQDIDAIKSIVSSELQELVSELGIVGGPRVHRVNEIFGLLLREPIDDAKLTAGSGNGQSTLLSGGRQPKGRGHIAMLGDRLGLDRDRISTVNDEQNFTNFLILTDYVSGLQRSWKESVPYFNNLRNSKAEPYLGTQLVLIARALTAVAETVNEAMFAMDSVFIGPEERQTFLLNYEDGYAMIPWVKGDLYQTMAPNTRPCTYQYSFGGDSAAMFVSELMDWTVQAVTEQAQDLIQNAGKDGVIALYPTLDQLRRLMHGAMTVDKPYQGAQHRDGRPHGYFTDRVQRALQSVASQLDEAADLCGKIYAREEQPREQMQSMNVLDALRKDDSVIREIQRIMAPTIAWVNVSPSIISLGAIQQSLTVAVCVGLSAPVPTAGGSLAISLDSVQMVPSGPSSVKVLGVGSTLLPVQISSISGGQQETTFQVAIANGSPGLSLTVNNQSLATILPKTPGAYDFSFTCKNSSEPKVARLTVTK